MSVPHAGDRIGPQRSRAGAGGAVLGPAVPVVRSPLTLAADAGGVWVASLAEQRLQRVTATP